MKTTLLTSAFTLSVTLCMAQAQNMPQGMPANMPQGAQGMQGGAMPQMGNMAMFNQLTVTGGSATVDGKNTNSAIYSYSGADSVLTMNFSNVAANEGLVVFYYKKTKSDLKITFPADIKPKQPSQMGGVTVSGSTFTLSSSENGAFQINIKNENGVNTVFILRTQL